MKIYNSLTRKKEEFVPLNTPKVTMYACGLTPQNHPHLGHAISAIRFSTIRRYLTYKGFNVIFTENVTDVDDKIIEKSKELNLTPSQVAEKYYNEYRQSLAKLNLPVPNYTPKVTEYIPQIIKYISKLIEKGIGYSTIEGDVYFDVTKKKDYGKLSNRTLDDLVSGTRVSLEENKKNVVDFALWKASTSEGASWNSPWGIGRPGWHIECSVMSNDLLGPTIDIHCGGLDLVFPHHENEIAQCEAHNDVEFVKYWVHAGLLKVDGKKMSKSVGNFTTIDSALNKYGKELITFVVLRHHYRSAIDFNDKLFRDNLNSLLDFYLLLDNNMRKQNYSSNDFADKDSISYKLIREFENAMDDDFNTPAALVVLSKYLQKAESLFLNDEHHSTFLKETIIKLGRILGLFDASYSLEKLQIELVHFQQLSLGLQQIYLLSEIKEIIEERQVARLQGNFKESDRIRDLLYINGISLMDSKGQIKWRFVSI